MSCNNFSTNREVDIIRNNVSVLNDNLSYLELKKKVDFLEVKISPSTPVFEHKQHSRAIISYLVYNLYKKEKVIQTSFQIRKNKNEWEFFNYDTTEIKSIVDLYSRDSILCYMVDYTVNNFDQYDAAILDEYLKVVISDFPMLKTNELSDYNFYTLFEQFIYDCNNGDKGNAESIFLVLFSMDNEMDILKSNKRYSKLIKGLWEICYDKDIEIAAEELFPL